MKRISCLSCFVLLITLFCAITFLPKAYSATENGHEKPLFLKGGHNPHPQWHGDELDESGGPDGFGYIYRDSQEPDGPVYQWIDISGTGTPITDMGDDDSSGPIPLPWDFPFYGNSYNEIYICSNGFLQFGGGSTVYNNTALPSSTPPNNLIAFFWDDLNPASGGTIYYGTDENGSWICQFAAVREYGANGVITAEIILEESGLITIQYQSLAAGIDTNGETIGIENEAGTTGLMASLDGSPASYPFNELAIRFETLPPNASVSGVVTDQETGDPVEGATVRFGSIETETLADGSYQITAIWAGEYDVRIFRNGYYDHREDGIILNEGANTYDVSLEPSPFPHGLVGYWTFDNPDELTAAVIGNELWLEGEQTPIDGPEPGDGAVTIGTGSFYRCYHDIEANGAFGAAEWVNEFTIVMDVRIPALGQWYSLYQTNWPNTNDADWFISTSGQVGVNDTGYSEYALAAGEWYRLAITVSLGVHYDYYLDGQLLQVGGAQAYEGRFSLYPASGANQVLFFADNNGEDGPIDVARLLLFDRDLSPAELDSLGGFGHEFEGPQVAYMEPYLQSPTPSSIYVCWHSSASTESVVEYGLTEALGLTATGDYQQFNANVIWHWTQLTDLNPATTYYYRMVSDTAVSPIHSFRTQPADDARNVHIRFAAYGDNRTDVAMHTEVVRAMKEKVVELWGEDVSNQLNVVMNVGDIVTSGNSLNQYENEYFNPIAQLSGEVPFMVSIGNHEAEADYFYQYMKYEDFAGDEGERYYSFRIGPVLFICLNSNTRGDTQLSWLEGVLDNAETDDEIDWVFTFLHHPGHSEIWPDGNTAWVQNSVIPLLAGYSKAEALSYGHSHNYEHGAWPEGNLHLLLVGGGGSALDRWGMYGNQTDYPEIFRAHDYYGYTLFDIDVANERYEAFSYSLGHTDLPMDNILIDSWTRDKNASPPETPIALAPDLQGSNPPILTASPYTGESELMSSQFQLCAEDANWDNCLIDAKRDWENVYNDSGPPDYEPINWNAGVDLRRYRLQPGVVELGSVYRWRVRYRDRNLLWSDWSAPMTFEVADEEESPNFTADVVQGEAPLLVRFTDLSIGEPSSWMWDLDGDGTPDSYQRDPEWTYEEAGSYSVSLTVSYDGDLMTETKEDYILVLENSVARVEAIPAHYSLTSPHPNPFNSTTTFSVALPEPAELTVQVFNLLGRRVAILASDRYAAGLHSFSFTAAGLSSGIYLVHAQIPGKFSDMKKVVLIR